MNRKTKYNNMSILEVAKNLIYLLNNLKKILKVFVFF
jgi:hypothetical protein